MRRTAPLWAAALLLCVPSLVSASGSIRTLSLEQAVRGATFVLVVERAKPASKTIQVPVPLNDEDDEGKRRKVKKMKTAYHAFKVLKRLKPTGEMQTTWSGRSYLHPKKERTFDPDKAAKKGDVIRVVSSQTVINNSVMARYLRDGTRKIPIYPHLAESLLPGKKAKRFLLLCGYNLRYEAFAGEGGLGLVSIKKLKQVKKLLKK